MKAVTLLFLCSIICEAQAQAIGDTIQLSNHMNQIFAVENPLGRDTTSEAYADFVYHTGELAKHSRIPVNRVICQHVYFLTDTLAAFDNSGLGYVFIRKNDRRALVLPGVDTWESLLHQEKRFFGKRKTSRSSH